MVRNMSIQGVIPCGETRPDVVSMSVTKCGLADPERVTEGIHTGRRPGVKCQTLCWLGRTSMQMDRVQQGVREQESDKAAEDTENSQGW